LNPKIGLVVPTLGTRPRFLLECLESIRAAGQCFVLVVAPSSFDASDLLQKGLVDKVVLDPANGLAHAINAGISALPEGVRYVNWLGDDDQLTAGSLVEAGAALDNSPQAALVFGSCDYMDEFGNVIWKNRSGPWAIPLLRVGPDLIPQPGALFRRSKFEAVGGLNSKYSWAFDFDLLLKLNKTGRFIFLNKTLARFRWHPESLSVEHRKQSVREASMVRVSHLPAFLRPVSILWEEPVKVATLIAGKRVSAKAQKKAKK
jgi:GT2 family glycosyltransferase